MSESILLLDIGSIVPPLPSAPVTYGSWFPQPHTPPPLPVPSAFAAERFVGGVKCSWGAVDRAGAEYELQRAPDVGGNPGAWARVMKSAELVYSSNETERTHWRVRLVLHGHEGAWSAIVGVWPQTVENIGTGGNLLRKFDFSDMSVGGWSNASVAVAPASGIGSQPPATTHVGPYITTTGGGTYEAWWTVTPGDVLDVAGNLFCDVNVSGALGVHFQDAAGGNVSFAQAIAPTAAGQWQRRSARITVPANAVRARGWLHPGNGGNNIRVTLPEILRVSPAVVAATEAANAAAADAQSAANSATAAAAAAQGTASDASAAAAAAQGTASGASAAAAAAQGTATAADNAITASAKVADNLVPQEFSVFARGRNVTVLERQGCDVAVVENASATNGHCLHITTTSTSNVARVSMGYNTVDLNIPLAPQRYIVSYRARTNAAGAGHIIRPNVKGPTGTTRSGADQALTQNWTDYYTVVDLSAETTAGAAFWWHVNRSSVSGRQIWIDRLKIEPEIKPGALPSPWSPGNPAYIADEANKLAVPGSGKLLGDQRNAPRSMTNAYGAIRSTASLSATSAGAVSINAHSVYMGGTTIAYNAVANAVTGLTPGATYVIYCLDPLGAGGTRTWLAAVNPNAAMQVDDGVVVAGQITIPTSGSGSGGGGGGGTNPDDWCVDADSIIPGASILAGDIRPGDALPCYNQDADLPGIVHLPVLSSSCMDGIECLRLVTESGASVISSIGTPMTLRDGSLTYLPDMLGRDALVFRASAGFAWEVVTELQPVGPRRVARINVRQQCYFAGDRAGAYVCTHNNYMIKR